MKKLNPEDYIGKRFGKLTIFSYDNRDKRKNFCVICKCDCGNEIITNINFLLKGTTKSCGCLKVDIGREKIHMVIEKSYDKQQFIRVSNKILQKNNTSGIRGVSFIRKTGRWRACVQINKKQIYKDFWHKQDAIDYRKELEETYFKPVINEFKANLDNPTTK